MANNYSPATVWPPLPKAAFNDEMLEILNDEGIEYENSSNGNDTLYFYAEVYCGEVDDVFKKALLHPSSDNVKEVQIKGAYYCDKMRPEEFGGFVIRITRDKTQYSSTDNEYYKFQNEHSGLMPEKRATFKHVLTFGNCDVQKE